MNIYVRNLGKLLVILLVACLACVVLPVESVKAVDFVAPQWGTRYLSTPYNMTYYVSAEGDDTTGDGSQVNPWASLAKTAEAINSSGLQDKN